MPRRRPRRKPSARRSPVSFRSAALTAAWLLPPQSATEAGSGSGSESGASLSSEVCDDYYRNLLAAGLMLGGGGEGCTLDLAAGLTDGEGRVELSGGGSGEEGEALSRREEATALCGCREDLAELSVGGGELGRLCLSVGEGDREIALSLGEKDCVSEESASNRERGEEEEDHLANASDRQLEEQFAAEKPHTRAEAQAEPNPETGPGPGDDHDRGNHACVTSEEQSEPKTPDSSSPKHSARAHKPLSPSAAPFNPSKPALSPSAPPAPPPAEAEYVPPPLPQMTFRSPADRADWQLIEEETVSAYCHFKRNAQPGTTYTCPPMPGAKARLAMHRAAEVLGCRSLSAGEGDERCVVLTWTKNGMFQISEASVVLAVRAVLVELFPPASLGKLQSKARACDDPVKQQLREERKARRKQQKLEAAVKVADAGVDPELVDMLVERQDWYALDLLYKGVKVPGLNKKKKKAKAKAKAEEAEALQQASAAMPVAAPFAPPFAAGFVPPPPPPPGVGAWYPGPFPGPGLPGMGPFMGHVQFQSQMRFQSRMGHAPMNAKPLEKSNKGFVMLEKMGWKEGEGLGSTKEGRTEPLQPQKRPLRTGLGN